MASQRKLSVTLATKVALVLGCATTISITSVAVNAEPPADDIVRLPAVVSETQPVRSAAATNDQQPPNDFRSHEPGTAVPMSQTAPIPVDRFPIDLPTTLQLAGANNLQIAFARQQTTEAIARVRAANLLWVPNLRAGVVYNNHSGRIQATQGDVIQANRSSLFAGAGAMSDQAPLAGGSGGPARMFVDLPLVDVLLEPLAARQARNARESHHAATFNDALLAASQAYLKLQQAESQLAITSEAIDNARALAELTTEFAKAGQGLQADAERAAAELSSRQQDHNAAEEVVGVSSAELARLLRLDQSTILFPAESPVPLNLVPAEIPLPELIQQAIASRPETSRESCRVAESQTRQRKEQLRPWTPNLFAGFSGGGFGGSPGSSIDSFGNRADFDVGAIWEWKNLGLGNRAQQQIAGSRYQQAQISATQVRDIIASEVAAAYRRVAARHDQLQPATNQVDAARRALDLNLEGIRGSVVRPIEAQQAIGALANAKRNYLTAVIGYNAAQLALIRAIGQPPSLEPVFSPQPDLMPPGEQVEPYQLDAQANRGRAGRR